MLVNTSFDFLQINVSDNEIIANLGRVRLGSIRNKNNWNNASKRLGAILIPEYLDSILAILLPGAE